MQIKMIKDLKVGHAWIRKGEELTVRTLPGNPFDFSRPYQVIDGNHSGVEIPQEYCISLTEKKTYTEQEYHAMKDDYEKKLLIMEDAQECRERELLKKLKQAHEEKQLLQEEINELIQSLPIELKVDRMIADWLEADYKGDEVTDRRKFAEKLVSFMRRELEKQSG